MGFKECSSCFQKIAVARSTCNCGHVFRKRKSTGFQEMPIVLTPGRLRTVGRPVRTKKPKDHGADFIYHSAKVSSETKTTDNSKKNGGSAENRKSADLIQDIKNIKVEVLDEDDTTLKEIAERIIDDSKDSRNTKEKTTDKLYPKRDRNKSIKYEAIHTITKRKVNKTNSSEKTRPSSKKQNNKDNVTGEKVIAAESSDDSSCDLPLSTLCKHPVNQSDVSPSVILLRKDDGKLFSENIDAHIEIQLDNNELPVKTDEQIENEPKMDDEIVFVYDTTSRKMIVSRSMKNNVKKSPTENQPLSSSDKTTELKFSPDNTLKFKLKSDSTGKIKRKVGRPRIHFEVKPKRPVGRPRKSVSLSHSPLKKSSCDVLSPTMVSIPIREREEQGFVQDHQEFQKRGRGRPKGSKDVRPRKMRTDFIEHSLISEDSDGTPYKVANKRTGRCFLSPPSLMASAKRERIRNEMLETVERERLQRKLERNNDFSIPPQKRELFTLILDEINRRILSQTFTCL